MSSKALTRTGRGLLAAGGTAVLATLALVFATAALAANPSSVVPLFVADGNAYNDPPLCLNKINGDSGSISGTDSVSGVGYTITLTGNAADKTASFTITDTSATVQVLVSQVVVKAGTNANIFSYPAGTSSDTVYGTGKEPENNGLTAGGDLRPANERNGVSHVCFNVQAVSATAVALRSFSASPAAGAVMLRWRTASEANVLGYNLYALVHGKRVKLNAKLVASKGAGAHAYSFSYRLPQGKQAPSRFWLQTINLDGLRQWHAARLAR